MRSGQSRPTVRLRIPRSTVGRAVMAISGTAMVAQLLAIAAAPVLTRLYSPDEYGAFFIVNAVSVVLAAGLALRFELAVPLPAEDAEARNLVKLAIAAVVGLVLVALGVLVVGSPAFAAGLDLPGSPWILVLCAPMAASVALFAVLNAVAVRERRYGAIARRQIVVAVLTVLLQIAAGVSGTGVVGLVVSTLLAQVVGAASLAFGSDLLSRRTPRETSPLKGTFVRYRKFPYLLAPAGWLNSLGANLPVVVLGALYSTQAAGWFGLTLRIVALPASFVGTAVARVYISELALRRRERHGTERALFLKTSRMLGLVAVVLGTGLFVLGPAAFDVVFGQEWAESGDMAQAFALGAAFQILASPLSETLVVYERVVAQIAWDGSRMILTIGSLVVVWTLGGSPIAAVWAFSCASALCYAANWEMCRRTVSADKRHDDAGTAASR